MYLKSLVLKGFKSFADRSALTLEPGITAVVGPNGSGKSNISDAVLWVLGERNAKNLRGQAMEDVIFAGSSARKASGLAEVDLVLDNSDGTLPVDFDEVAITRRMYRNGESEYLINGHRRPGAWTRWTSCTIRAWAPAPIPSSPRRSLDSILESKPEDRRALIEEAAGVQAQHKQSASAKSERKPARHGPAPFARPRRGGGGWPGSWGRSSARPRRRAPTRSARPSRPKMSLTIAVDDSGAGRRRSGMRPRRGRRRLPPSWRSEGAPSRRPRPLVKCADKERIGEETPDAGDLSRRHRAAATVVERFDSAAMMLRERRRAATARAGELELSIEANAVKADEAASELARATAQYEEAAAELDAAKKKVSDLDAVYRDLGVRRGSLERELSALSKDTEKMTAERETARRRHAENTEALSHGLAHVQVVEGRAAELALELARAQEEAERAAAGAAEADGELSALVADEAAARAAVGTAVQSRDAARAAMDEARDAHRALSVEIATLEEMERSSALSAGEARAWLVEHVDEVLGLCEPLSHVIQASAGFEPLVESLLGGDVATLLVEDAGAVELIAGQLAAAGAAGEASFLIRDDASPSRIRGAARVRRERFGGAEGVPLVDELLFPEEARAP